MEVYKYIWNTSMFQKQVNPNTGVKGSMTHLQTFRGGMSSSILSVIFTD